MITYLGHASAADHARWLADVIERAEYVEVKQTDRYAKKVLMQDREMIAKALRAFAQRGEKNDGPH